MTVAMRDLLVVGGGPAGLRAAVEATARGLSTVLVDEGPEPGGQIYRSAESGPFSGGQRLGPDYATGAELAAAFRATGAEGRFGSMVFQIEAGPNGGFQVSVAAGGGASIVTARTVIVATGAHERPFPIPGWTLPGVMTAGAAQTMLKAQGMAPRGRTVLAGTGPLLYLLAAQYAALGIPIVALLDTMPFANWRQALPHLPGFITSAYAWKGMGLLWRARASTRVVHRVKSIAAEGDGRLTAVRFKRGGAEETIAADLLLLHQGVVPQVNLTMAAGARHVWSETRLAYEPERDDLGRTSVPGLFIAGDTGGIGGARTAEAEGALAAIGAIRSFGATGDGLDAAEQRWRGMKARALVGRDFLDALYRPNASHMVPADDVVVCRCEEVTAGEIREAVRRGARGPNQVKAFTRAGMGPCQARICGLTTHAIVAQESGSMPGETDYMTIRAPVKPVTVAQIAALADAGETAESQG